MLDMLLLISCVVATLIPFIVGTTVKSVCVSVFAKLDGNCMLLTFFISSLTYFSVAKFKLLYVGNIVKSLA